MLRTSRMLTTGFDRCQGNGLTGRIAVSELSAGTEHVSSAALANKHIKARLMKRGLKAQDLVRFRATKAASWKFIKGNQINLTSNPFEEAGQALCVGWLIIDAGQEHVLKRQPAVRRKRNFPASRDECFERSNLT